MTKLKSKVKKQMNDTDLHESLLNIKSAVAEATGDVKSRANELIAEVLENFQTKTSDYQNDIEDYIREKPLKSVGIAMVAALLIGKFVL